MWWDGWEPGDLGWTRSHGLVGWLIRFGEDVRYHGWARAISARAHRHKPAPGDVDWGNHIFVYLGNGMIAEALAGGITVDHISRYPAAWVTRLSLAKAAAAQGVTPNTAAGLSFAWACAGAEYAFLSIASIIGQIVTPEKLDFNWGDAMVCSTYGLRVWEHMGLNVGGNPFVKMPTRCAVLAGVL